MSAKIQEIEEGHPTNIRRNQVELQSAQAQSQSQLQSPPPEDSLDPDPPSPDIVCDLCEFVAKSVGGLKTHRGKGKCLARQGKDGAELKVKCPHCVLEFSKAGLTTHARSAHPAIFRETVTARFETPVHAPESKNAGEAVELQQTMLHWLSTFLAIRNTDRDTSTFDIRTAEFSTTLVDMVDVLPGPKHPARKFHLERKEAKKSGHRKGKQATPYDKSSNPERNDRRRRAAGRAKYQYEMVQYWYHNVRRRAVKTVMDGPIEPCTISMEELYDSFVGRFEEEKKHVRATYPNPPSPEEQRLLNDGFVMEISVEIITAAAKSIRIDTSPGPDHVIMRIVKQQPVAAVLAVIATIMLQWGYTPAVYRHGRTVLVPKGPDGKDRRPITICSVLRRVVERVLDRYLKSYTTVSACQYGFTASPGVHVASSIIGGCLSHAKDHKNDICVVMLDVRKAFEEVPHTHIIRCLQSAHIPDGLRALIIDLVTRNTTQLELNGAKSKVLHVRKGLFQGCPLSPTLYNFVTDYVVRELSEVEMSIEYGYVLTSDLPRVSVAAFADDLTPVGKSVDAGVVMVNRARSLLLEIDLHVNTEKSKAIVLEKGRQMSAPLDLRDGTLIPVSQPGEKNRYLGTTITDQPAFDHEKMIRALTDSLEKLTKSNLLHPDQKLNIINQFVWPQLIFPLQTAPLNTFPTGFLHAVDVVVRSHVIEIIQLPVDTPSSFLYAPRKFKGLGLMNAEWESNLQHINICFALEKDGNPLVAAVRNLRAEMDACIRRLEIPPDKIPPLVDGKGKPQNPVPKFREEKRQQEFDKWVKPKVRGQGVALYQQCPAANGWIYNRKGISSSEWTTGLKMITNGAAVRALHGRSQDGNLCRSPGCEEIETLAHVLGFCPKGSLLRNSRHDRVEKLIGEALKRTGLEINYETPCIAINGSNRRTDIVAIDRGSGKGFIIDPTIRFEGSLDQPNEVDKAKKNIYDSTIPFFRQHTDIQEWEVIGLQVGARGTITTFFEDFRKRFRLPSDLIKQIAVSVLKDSCNILHNHLFSQEPANPIR